MKALSPDSTWKTSAHLLTESIYGEIIFLPQSKRQQQQQQQHMAKENRMKLYPVPMKIFQNNRFKAFRDVRLTQRSLLYNKKTSEYMLRDDDNYSEQRIGVPYDKTTGDMSSLSNIRRVKMSIKNNTDKIHTTTGTHTINKIPESIKSPDLHEYHYGGFIVPDYIGIDVTDSNNSVIVSTVNSKQMTMKKLQNNGKLSRNPETSAIMDQLKERFFRSNTEIFNQILNVRKDLNNLRSDIRKIQKFIGNFNFNIVKYITAILMQQLATNKLTFFNDNNFSTKDSDKITIQIDNNHDFPLPMYNSYGMITKKQAYHDTFPWSISMISSPLLVWRSGAATAAATLQEERLLQQHHNHYLQYKKGNIHTNGINFLKLPVEIPIKWHYQHDDDDNNDDDDNVSGNVIKSIAHNWQLLSSIRRNVSDNAFLIENEKTETTTHAANTTITTTATTTTTSTTTIATTSTVDGFQKFSNEDNLRIKIDKICINDEQKLSQLQSTITTTTATTTATTTITKYAAANVHQLFVTVRAPSNERGEMSNSITTETHQPFAIKRYIANARIYSDKIISQLINLQTTKSFIATNHRLLKNTATTTVTSITLISHNITTTTQLSTLPFDNNSYTVLLNFSEPSRLLRISDQITVTRTTSTATNNTAKLAAIITTTTTAAATTTTTTIMARTIISPLSGIARQSGIFEKILSNNLEKMPPLIPLKPNFIGTNFDGTFVPWLNDGQRNKQTLWPDRLLFNEITVKQKNNA